jgi:hypothetical protein
MSKRTLKTRIGLTYRGRRRILVVKDTIITKTRDPK